jgi:hypothetical protein
MTILEFTDRHDKFLGRVSEVDGKLKGNTTQVDGLLNSFRARGTSDADFIAKFDGFDNGYLRAKSVPE